MRRPKLWGTSETDATICMDNTHELQMPDRTYEKTTQLQSYTVHSHILHRADLLTVNSLSLWASQPNYTTQNYTTFILTVGLAPTCYARLLQEHSEERRSSQLKLTN